MPFTTVPPHAPGDTFPSADWNLVAADLNLSVLRPLAPPATLAAGSTAASFDFASIPATFQHLLLVYQVSTDQASASFGQILMRLNAISSAGYYSQYSFASAATTTTAESLASTSGIVGYMALLNPAANLGGNPAITVGQILIPNYSRAFSGPYLQWLAESYSIYSTTTGTQRRCIASGATVGDGNPVNDVRLLPATGNFAGPAVVSLYGVPVS